MNSDNFTAQIIGVFLAETVKNVAKGSANIVYENVHLFFDSEITALGLNDSLTPETITEQLNAQPAILGKIQRKLNAHPTLAEEITNIIEEQTGKNLTTINITSNRQSGGQTAHTIINNNPVPVAPVNKVNIDVEYDLEQAFDEQETYRLKVSLTNLGEKPISNYRVEVEFPRKYLNDSTGMNFEVKEKITEEYRFFRISSESQNSPIYPDDKQVIFSPNYFVRSIVPYTDTLRIKVYIDEELKRSIEKSMKELVDP